jgi:hypothetical protein
LVDVLQYRFVETQIGQELLQAGVLILKLLELPDLIGLQTRVLLLPTVKRLLGNPHLAGHIGHGHPELRLLQHHHNLRDRKPFPLHGKLLDPKGQFAGKLSLPMVRFPHSGSEDQSSQGR